MSVASAPAYADILAQTISAMQSATILTEDGQTVLLDMSPGSYNLALATAIAVNIFALYQRQSDIQAALDPTQATGDDLDRLEALIGAERKPATAASKPVIVGRSQVSSTQVQVPVGWTFIVQTSQGNVVYVAAQGANEPPGVALTVQPGNQYGYVFGDAQAPDPTTGDAGWLGTIGNTPTGLTAQFGSPIAGLDTILNVPVGTPTVPTATIVGTAGSASRQYRLVGHGATGTTLPGPVVAVSNAPNAPSTSNYVSLSWTFGTDGGAVQPVSYDVLVSVDGGTTWLLLANVAGTGGTTTYNDQGATATAYSGGLPVQDTSNWGVGGVETESDAAFRLRAPTTIAADGGGTAAAIAAAVEAVDGVVAAYVTDAGAGVATVSVITAATPPSAGTVTAINAAIQVTKAGGVTIGDATIVAPTPVAVSYTIALTSSSTAAGVEASIAVALGPVFSGLGLGDPVRFSAVISALMAVPGVAAVTALSLTPQGGDTYSGADVPGNALGVYTLGTISAATSS